MRWWQKGARGGTRPQVTAPSGLCPTAPSRSPCPPPVADKPETALSLSWTLRPGPAALETGVFGKNKKIKNNQGEWPPEGESAGSRG